MGECSNLRRPASRSNATGTVSTALPVVTISAVAYRWLVFELLLQLHAGPGAGVNGTSFCRLVVGYRGAWSSWLLCCRLPR